MAIDHDQLMGLTIPTIRESYGPQRAILYALGCGLGQDPTDTRQLAYVYEKGLRVLPTMANVIGHPGFWLRDLPTGVDATQVVHGQQKVTLHQVLPVAADIVSTTRVIEVADKGRGRGAVITTQRVLSIEDSDIPLATIEHVSFCRADGGFGGSPGEKKPPAPIPDRAPDATCSLASRPETALLYRLSGDVNPLHADPEVAAKAGFARPILHGMASFGMAGHAVLARFCAYDPARLLSLEARFAAAVYPGETIDFDFWESPGGVQFRGRVAARDITVLAAGRAELRGSEARSEGDRT